MGPPFLRGWAEVGRAWGSLVYRSCPSSPPHKRAGPYPYPARPSLPSTLGFAAQPLLARRSNLHLRRIASRFTSAFPRVIPMPLLCPGAAVHLTLGAAAGPNQHSDELQWGPSDRWHIGQVQLSDSQPDLTIFADLPAHCDGAWALEDALPAAAYNRDHTTLARPSFQEVETTASQAQRQTRSPSRQPEGTNPALQECRSFWPAVGYAVVDTNSDLVLCLLDGGHRRLSRQVVCGLGLSDLRELLKAYALRVEQVFQQQPEDTFLLQGLVNEVTALDSCMAAWHPKLYMVEKDRATKADSRRVLDCLDLAMTQMEQLLEKRKSYLLTCSNFVDVSSGDLTKCEDLVDLCCNVPDLGRTCSIYHQSRRQCAFTNRILREVLTPMQAGKALLAAAPHYPDMLAIADLLADTSSSSASRGSSCVDDARDSPPHKRHATADAIQKIGHVHVAGQGRTLQAQPPGSQLATHVWRHDVADTAGPPPPLAGGDLHATTLHLLNNMRLRSRLAQEREHAGKPRADSAWEPRTPSGDEGDAPMARTPEKRVRCWSHADLADSRILIGEANPPTCIPIPGVICPGAVAVKPSPAAPRGYRTGETHAAGGPGSSGQHHKSQNAPSAPGTTAHGQVYNNHLCTSLMQPVSRRAFQGCDAEWAPLLSQGLVQREEAGSSLKVQDWLREGRGGEWEGFLPEAVGDAEWGPPPGEVFELQRAGERESVPQEGFMQGSGDGTGPLIQEWSTHPHAQQAASVAYSGTAHTAKAPAETGTNAPPALRIPAPPMDYGHWTLHPASAGAMQGPWRPVGGNEYQTAGRPRGSHPHHQRARSTDFHTPPAAAHFPITRSCGPAFCSIPAADAGLIGPAAPRSPFQPFHPWLSHGVRDPGPQSNPPPEARRAVTTTVRPTIPSAASLPCALVPQPYPCGEAPVRGCRSSCDVRQDVQVVTAWAKPGCTSAPVGSTEGNAPRSLSLPLSAHQRETFRAMLKAGAGQTTPARFAH